MDEKVKEYLEDPPLQLPIKHSTLELNLTTVTGHCLNCDADVEDLRGTVTEWPTCLQVKFAGICHKCNLVTPFEFRWSKDSMLHKGQTGWKEFPIKHSLWSQIKAFFGFKAETLIKTNQK